MRIVQRWCYAFASVALVAAVVTVSAEAKVAGPVFDCPFSVLPLLHVHPGASEIFCNSFGWGQTAN